LTNDSLLYLDYSRSLDTFGWVTGGYRQFGYPLYLALVRGSADLIGVEPLFAAAIIQRGLLLGAVVLAWLHWRWWSLPFVLLLLTSETLVYSNLLLIEGLALPLAALMVFPTIYCLRAIRDGSYVEKRRTVLMLATLVALIALTLFSLRFTLLVFGAVPLALTIAFWPTELRRSVAAILAGFILAGALITLAMSAENHQEWGVFSPSAYSAPVRYYYAWMLVFRVHPENQTNPDLAEFYDEGRLREFITSVWLDETTHEEKWALYDQRTDAMLDAAGISIMGSRLTSMAWSLAGGRVNDVGSALDLIIPATRADIERAMYLNGYYEENGAAAFEERYNEGRMGEAVITNAIGRPLPSPGTRWVIALLLPASLIVMLAGLWRPTTRLLAATGLTVVLTQAIGMGWIRSDNLRFLLPGSVFGVAVGTAVLCHLVASRRRPTRQAAVTV
ncbi:MAG TPA: hypothetical protein VI141_10000, partial [Acidimicrobiia bacterium]